MYRILLISAEEGKGSSNYKSRENAYIVQVLRLTDNDKRFLFHFFQKIVQYSARLR